MTNKLESAIWCLVNISKYRQPSSSLRYSQNKTKEKKKRISLQNHEL